MKTRTKKWTEPFQILSQDRPWLHSVPDSLLLKQNTTTKQNKTKQNPKQKQKREKKTLKKNYIWIKIKLKIDGGTAPSCFALRSIFRCLLFVVIVLFKHKKEHSFCCFCLFSHFLQFIFFLRLFLSSLRYTSPIPREYNYFRLPSSHFPPFSFWM